MKPLVILAGPTAAGKTKLAVSLAKKINGAVISADSMQVYKYMDIGSAKVTQEEMDGIEHYLVDVLDPAEEFHVVRFKQMAEAALEQIYANGQIPIIAGEPDFISRRSYMTWILPHRKATLLSDRKCRNLPKKTACMLCMKS